MSYYVDDAFDKIIKKYRPFNVYELIREAHCKLLYADLDDETGAVSQLL